MAKNITQGFNDADLDAIALSTTLSFCSAEPANQAGIAAVLLGSTTVAGGDFSIAGTSPDRVLTVGGKSFTASGTGSVTHVVLDDGVDIAVTTCASTAVISGTTYNSTSYTFTKSVA